MVIGAKLRSTDIIGTDSVRIAWFRGGLVFKAHAWLYHSTLGSRVMKKNKKDRLRPPGAALGD